MVLKAFLVIILLFIAYFLWHAVPITREYINDYCYLDSFMIGNQKVYEREIELEKAKKVPGWEERVKRMEETSAEPDPDETFFHSLLTSFCGEPGTHKPIWLSEPPVDRSSKE